VISRHQTRAIAHQQHKTREYPTNMFGRNNPIDHFSSPTRNCPVFSMPS
jgi:hypothetical protein